MTVERPGRRPDRQTVRLPLPPTIFAIAMLTGVAALGLPQLIGAHLTRDPMGKATELGLAALLALPLALAIAAIRPGGLQRLVGRESVGLLAVRGLAKAGFLLAIFGDSPQAWPLTLMDYTGYVVAAVMAAALFGARTPLRDKLALTACFLCTVGVSVAHALPHVTSLWPGGAVLTAILCLGLFVALTHRLAPHKGVATLMFWDSVVICAVLLWLYVGHQVAWDGGPWNQMVGVVVAAVIANLAWITAYAHAPVSRLAPFEFLALPLLLGVVTLFGQSMVPLVAIGFAAVVPICALLALFECLIVYGERQASAS